MTNNRYIGMYYNETELMNKVDELKQQGWAEDDIYVLMKNDDQLTMMRNRHTPEVKSADDSWLDRFMGFISGEDHVRRMVDDLGFGSDDTDRYYSEIEQGGMLLYVDNGEANRFYNDNSDYYGRSLRGNDANLGANGIGVADQDMMGDPSYRMNKVLDDQHTPPDHLGQVGAEAVMDRPVDETLRSNRMNTDEEKMRLHEERLEVDRQRVQRGEVHVEKNVVEEPRSIDVVSKHDEVTIERRPVNETDVDRSEAFVDNAEGSIHIPVTEEQVEVRKKPVVTEEIVLKKRQVEDHETYRDTVRREEVDIDETGDVDVQGDRIDRDRAKW